MFSIVALVSIGIGIERKFRYCTSLQSISYEVLKGIRNEASHLFPFVSYKPDFVRHRMQRLLISTGTNSEFEGECPCFAVDFSKTKWP